MLFRPTGLKAVYGQAVEKSLQSAADPSAEEKEELAQRTGASTRQAPANALRPSRGSAHVHTSEKSIPHVARGSAGGLPQVRVSRGIPIEHLALRSRLFGL